MHDCTAALVQLWGSYCQHPMLAVAWRDESNPHVVGLEDSVAPDWGRRMSRLPEAKPQGKGGIGRLHMPRAAVDKHDVRAHAVAMVLDNHRDYGVGCKECHAVPRLEP